MSGPAQGSIQPQVTPFQTQVATGRTPDGHPVLVLTLHTVVGQVTVFLPPEGAESLAVDLTRGAAQAKSGLILPGPRPLPPARP